MFTVLKNLSNFITLLGDYVLYRRTYTLPVYMCLLLMVMSACFGGLTDTKFSWQGYTWQLVNCLFTSAYALYLSGVMDKIALHTSDSKRLSEFSMVYYNNLLSIVPLAILMVAFGEVEKLPYEPALQRSDFLAVAVMGGLLGFGISFTSLWFISRSTATVFSLTGSLNKIIVSVVGIIIFREVASIRNMVSIAVGLLAGVVFVFAKAYAPK